MAQFSDGCLTMQGCCVVRAVHLGLQGQRDFTILLHMQFRRKLLLAVGSNIT